MQATPMIRSGIRSGSIKSARTRAGRTSPGKKRVSQVFLGMDYAGADGGNPPSGLGGMPRDRAGCMTMFSAGLKRSVNGGASHVLAAVQSSQGYRRLRRGTARVSTPAEFERGGRLDRCLGY